MRSLAAIAFAALSLLVVGAARGEANEKSIGLEGSVVMPGFATEDATAFSLATWGLGAYAQYGVLDDLYAQARVLFAAFHASSTHVESYRGRMLSGQLHFASTQLHLELGGRYKVYSGSNLSPYVELMGGVLWATYGGQSFTDDQGRSFGIPIADKGEGSFTLSVGVAADYRVMNMFFVGIALRYVQAFGGAYARYVSMPVQLSYYW
jgi:hypothetical protein